MSNSQISLHYFNEFQKNANLLAGQFDWLNQLRQQSIEQFKALGLPKRNDEQWKYANFSALEKGFSVSQSSLNQTYNITRLESTYRMVFVDGCFVAHLSELPLDSEAVFVAPLSQAWQFREELIRQYLENYTQVNGFSLLNTSFVSEGVFIELKASLDKPLHILHLSTQAQGLQNLRNIIVLDALSEMSIIEEHQGYAASYFKNEITQLFLGNNAHLNYYKIQNESNQACHLSQFVVKQQQDSSINHFSLALGGLFSREDIQVDLKEKSSEVSLHGLYICGEKQYMDHHTRIDHHVAQCNSHENYRGILADQAQGVFNGKVVVHPQAQKTQAKQSNQNLLLSSQAEINTKPELEIYADDVKCAHGATVGELDSDALFYLRSRGIDEMNARILLTQAFAQEIVGTVSSPAIKEYLQNQVMNRLTHLLETPSIEVSK